MRKSMMVGKMVKQLRIAIYYSCVQVVSGVVPPMQNFCSRRYLKVSFLTSYRGFVTVDARLLRRCFSPIHSLAAYIPLSMLAAAAAA